VLFACDAQTPTSTVMSEERRDVVAEIVRKHGAYLIEDDAYASLFAAPPRPISLRIPDAASMWSRLPKCLRRACGLRP